ncbi:VWA domain-containing protein [bacterium]|nr:VWA domain-containing protein [bacterium]
MERVFLLDRSGSMEDCRQDTIDGMNAFLESQRELGGTMTLCLFDHEFETVYEKVSIAEAPCLTMDTFVPRGGTALLDAMGQVLKMNLSDDAMVIVLTDGEENSSTNYTAAHIKDLVEMKPWKFVYLGANQDAVLNAQRIGIHTSVGYDPARTPELFRAVSETVTRYSQSLE